uniref:uncharacterized protein LOC122608049 n=1 Tax=Erigeron canadensis TaxID=72917 RepID=UPI001CB957B9|nr:uncharacterized protein LOC122608049 [Erigeron canadensis]
MWKKMRPKTILLSSFKLMEVTLYPEKKKTYAGIQWWKESDTDSAASSEWDLVSDEEMMQEEQPLQRLVPDISLPSLPAPPASMFASSGITSVLASCMKSPTRNGDHRVPAGPEWLPLTSMLTCALSRDEKFGFLDEYELQTQPNTPENFSFSAFEEILKNYSAVEDGNHAAVEY